MICFLWSHCRLLVLFIGIHILQTIHFLIVNWLQCEKIHKHLKCGVAWENWFDFSQPKSKSKPVTLFLGTRVLKSASNLVSHPLIFDLQHFTFHFQKHLTNASDHNLIHISHGEIHSQNWVKLHITGQHVVLVQQKWAQH